MDTTVTRFGLANTVTSIRLLGGLMILALLPAHVLVATALATLCLILDGIDGRIARARGEASRFGAWFDNEADAAVTLVLSISLIVLHVAGWWVLLIGAMRYLYLLASLALPKLRAPLLFSQARRVVGLGQAILLLAAVLAAGVFPRLAASGWLAVLPAIGLIALLWSFGRDAWQQLSAE
ncbi:CDP-alcohol phosphatidyltransferase family protein [Kribbella sp. NPDC051587]|uniref:CDP-alcohol phosphatidyltransferase family protein n=1 Tax=Kribbella sp. NPDC051587 TaxID=3364119 RepID=UPI003794AC1B